ncbi:MAG: M6 family metalloprotease domain-containing protein [Bacteroidales bacterium]|nr:M6 family metalloprotease domain-containing protein [Bacteroidales bacterium]
MKKLIALCCVTLFCCSALLAVPANPNPVEKTQPDGTKITVLIKGDEHVHWLESVDGYTLMYNDKKEVVFATHDSRGDLVPSKIIYRGQDLKAYRNVHKKAIEKIPVKLRYSPKQIEMRRQIRKMTSDAETSATGPQKAQAAVLGEKKVLCILASFSNKSFSKTKTDFENLMNQEGYTGGGNAGSVKDFYKENSYGKMSIVVTVAGPVTLPNTTSYYAPDDKNKEFARVAAELADAEVNYADYAVSGRVPTYHIIFAGYGDESIGNDDQIWSHQWGYAAITLDGVKVGDRYSCSPELRGGSGSTITAIGVVCHELCHAFGAPDYYDTDYEESGGEYPGTGNWDLMASGSWNGGSGNCPAHINMHQKILYGWVDPITLTSATSVTNMPASADSAVAYIIQANANGEHYVLENRQKKKFDSYVPGKGLLIYHVHKNALGGDCDNSSAPQEVYPVCASSSYSKPTSAVESYGTVNGGGCPFPGTSSKTSFGASTTPMMFAWQTDTAVADKPITNIAENTTAKTMSFDFMGGGTPPAPPEPPAPPAPCADSIVSFPFVEDFESINPCFVLQSADSANNICFGVFSAATVGEWYDEDLSAKSGSNVFEFTSYERTANNLPQEYYQYLITPKISVQTEKELYVKFWYLTIGENDENFRIGYSSICNSVEDFTWFAEETVMSLSWKEYEKAVPAGTKYIAINYTSKYLYDLSIDDLTIDTVSTSVNPPEPPVTGGVAYELVTSASQLVAGDKYIIASKNGDAWVGLGYQNENNRRAIPLNTTSSTAPATVNVETATSATDQTHVYQITLGGTSGAYTLYDEVNAKYLRPRTNDANGLQGDANIVKWTIGVATSGIATVRCEGNSTTYNRIVMRYNNTNPVSPNINGLFACYTSGTLANSQNDVYFYKLVNTSPPIDTPNIARVTFSPQGGEYSEAQTVTLSCATADAEIRYTLDSSTPTAASTLYSTPLQIATTATVKALAYKTGYRTLLDSLATATYAIVPPVPDVPDITIISPTAEQVFTGEVLVQFSTENFVAGVDGKFKISITGQQPVYTTDTFYRVNLVSGSYSVTVNLTTQDEADLTPPVSQTRSFSVDLPDVATPYFAPVAGVYADSVAVSIACATTEATLYYSLGEEYSAYNEPITLRTTSTVSTFAVKSGMDTSAVATATYTITTPPPIPEGYDYIEMFDSMPLATGTSYSNSSFIGNYAINWTFYGSREASGITATTDYFPINGKSLLLRRQSDSSQIFSQTLTDGIGNFTVKFRKAYTSNAKRWLELYVNDVLKGSSEQIGNTSGADATIYDFTVDNINVSGDVVIKIKLASTQTGNAQITIDNIAWTRYSFTPVDTPNIARVTFSPQGGEYSEAQTVTLSCATADAEIRYTLDGSTPTAASTLYSTPLQIATTATVKALAYKTGYRTLLDSLATATYTITTPPQCEPPTNAAANDITAECALLSWHGDVSEYVVHIWKSGEAYEKFFTTDTMLFVCDLNPETTYYYDVRSVCGAGDTSTLRLESEFTTSEAVGIEALGSASNAVKVYPNPSNGKIYVTVNTKSNIEIFTLIGTKILSRQVTKVAEFNIDRAGVYMLRATAANGEITTQKIIIR